jgi:hypothetical protein
MLLSVNMDVARMLQGTYFEDLSPTRYTRFYLCLLRGADNLGREIEVGIPLYCRAARGLFLTAKVDSQVDNGAPSNELGKRMFREELTI